MAPIKPLERWWPDYLGEPATAGAQNGLRYAFFRDERRLIVDRGGTVTVYDTGTHDIGGVSQSGTDLPSLEFHSQLGPVRLSELLLIR